MPPLSRPAGGFRSSHAAGNPIARNTSPEAMKIRMMTCAPSLAATL
jgi:hypothetical protein